jgi:hypothetical protein
MRSLKEIAQDIRKDWRRPYPACVPYLNAMAHLETVHDSYGLDSGHTVVVYFLCNAERWKGEVARKIKKELNQLIK